MNAQIISDAEEAKQKLYFKHSEYSPKLWAAKFGHLIFCGDYRNNTYKDADFQNWIHELFRILHTENVSEIRTNLLSKSEIEQIEKEVNDF